MYATYSYCSQSMRSLTSDDVAGLRDLYPDTGSTNTVPSVSIATPASGSAVGQGTAISFSGSAIDTEDGPLTTSLVWTSNVDGQIGTGGSFSRALSAGSHTITARATDSGGLSASRQVNVTVNSTNTAPTVTISSPGGGTSVVHGTSIPLSGSASDTQDGNLSASLVWTSNLDGQIGTGATFSRSLTAGSHTVTARATDQGGMSATRQVDVTVGSTPALRRQGIRR